jgi:NADPH2:quinone reductase
MRADKFGGPEQLKPVDAPEPKPAAGEVRIQVRSVGVNLADLVRLSGVLPGIELPYIPGDDVCGQIDAVGQGVIARG